MSVLPRYIIEALANALRNCLFVTEKLSLIVVSVHDVDNQSHKRVPWYTEVVIYLLKKFAADQAAAKSDVAILPNK